MHLSKTDFISYRDCKKNVWLKIHKPDVYKSFTISDFDKNIMETGIEIDSLARDLFPNGATIKNIRDGSTTEKLMKENTPVIYQPVFISPKFTAIADILVFNSETKLYDLYEVKSSTTSSEEGGRKTKDYIIDMAFQKAVLDEIGVKIGSVNLIRLNKKYVRDGEINLSELFSIEDFSADVEKAMGDVKVEMQEAYNYLSKTKEPAGECCCIFKGLNGHCTTSSYSNSLPPYPVHRISRVSKKKLTDLVNSGVYDIKDVPAGFELTDIQEKQVRTAKSDSEDFDTEGVKTFLKDIKYPIAFLDYETYPCALPRFDRYRPYRQIPFQFSLHVKDTPTSDIKHYEFIYTGKGCPDAEFVQNLEKYLPKDGSILVWNKKFEIGINRDIAERFEEHGVFIKKLNDRVIDLMIPFNGNTKVYDHPKFFGSASIKYVLPALVPELSYDSLEIQEGGSASDTWNRIVCDVFSEKEKDSKVEALKVYCEQDTLAMVKILEVLEKRVC